MNRLRLKIMIICMALIAPSVVHALSSMADLRWERMQRFRYYGDIDLLYRDYHEERDFRSMKTEVDRTIFLHKYTLGVSGYIWKPRFMIFASDFGLAFTSEDEDSVKYTTDNYGFSFNAVAFPQTPYPLLLNASRSTADFDYDRGDGTTMTGTSFNARWTYPLSKNTRLLLDFGHSFTTYDLAGGGDEKITVDSFYGEIRGSSIFDRRLLNLNNYRNNRANNVSGNNSNNDNNDSSDANDNNSNTKNNTQNTENANNRQNLGLRSRLSPSIIGLNTWEMSYELIRRKYDGNRIGYYDDTLHRLRLAATRNIWIFGSSAEAVLTKEGDSRGLYVGVNLERTTEKFYSTSSYGYSVSDSSYERNTLHELRNANTYWYNRDLSFTGGANFYRREFKGSSTFDRYPYSKISKKDTSSNYDLNIGANYARHFEKYFYQAFISSGYNYRDESDSPSGGKNDSYFASYGMRLESISRMMKYFSYRYSAYYYGSYDSEQNRGDTVGINFNVTRNYRRMFLSSTARLDYFIASPKNGGSTDGLSVGIDAAAGVRLTSFSSLSFAAGYTYNKSGSDVSKSLTLTESLSMFLFRNLNFNLSASQSYVEDDSGYSSRYYDFSATADYRLRKVMLHGECNYSTQDEDNDDTTKKRTIFLRLTRPFG